MNNIKKLENLEEKYDKLQSKIERMPLKIKRFHLESNLDSLNSCLQILGKEKIDETISDEYYDYVYRDSMKIIKDLYSNSDVLSQINNKLIYFYRDNNYYDDYSLYDNPVNSEKTFMLLEEFFKFLGNDVYSLYLDLKKNNHLFFVNDLSMEACCFDTSFQDNDYIFTSNYKNDFQLVCNVCHEMGHAYQDYLLRNQTNFATYNLYSEFFSLLFERIFCKYLVDNNLYQEECCNDKLSCYNGLLYQTIAAEMINCSLAYNTISYDDIYQENYNNLCINQDLLQNFEELFDNDDGTLKWESQVYVIDNILGSIFYRQIEKNFQQGFRNAKEFIMKAKYLDTREVLLDCLDHLNYERDYIQEAIENKRSYQYIKR